MAGVLHQALVDYKAGRIEPATYERPGLTREETGLVDHLVGDPLVGENFHPQLHLMAVHTPR